MDTGSFDGIRRNDERYRWQVMADHAGLVGKVEEAVRYQYELHGRLVRRLNEKLQNRDLQEMPPAKRRMVISHSLYVKNCRAIHSSYELVLGGKISASYALLRDIHEAVLAQYYIGLCEETEFSRYAKLHQWERAGSDHDFYRQRLYAYDALDAASRAYSKLCRLAHPGWDVRLIGFQYDAEVVSDALCCLLSSSLYNVMAHSQAWTFNEGFMPELLGMVRPFVERYLHDLDYNMEGMFPNHPDVANRVLWKPLG